MLVSGRSAGTELEFRGRTLVCREVAAGHFAGLDIALFSAGAGASSTWGPVAVEAGCRVVDNSSAYRQDPDVPLVVPEINGDLVPEAGAGGGIIANPNCSTIQVALALAPVDRLAGLQEVQVTTMQAVSGAGQAGVAELEKQLAQQAGSPAGKVFPRPIAGNVIPAIGEPLPGGFFTEEIKVEQELRRILGRQDDLAVTCTATRVPVRNGHSAAVRAVCAKPVTPAAALRAMAEFPGLEILADPHDYRTAREISGRTEVHVGRLRSDPNNSRALLMWVVADNLLKGAAWNAVQIAEVLAARSNG